ncbi:transcriptional regulator [Flammeovirgaceae bacterium 311]|nr:transcriptional regulator [Flammeovirgaceae bacterium 311]
MTKLYVLGPAELRNAEGELEHSFLAGPKRLALLTYLLLSRPRGFHRRDSLLPLFWPEQDQKSARNALSNMLYHIRKTLGGEAIENRGSEEIKIIPEIFWSDALAFEKALQEGDYQSAVKLYRSDLLKAFHVHDASSEFDYWLEQERGRFSTLATEAYWALAEKALREHDQASAMKWAKKAGALNPFAEQVQLQLILFLEELGEITAALEVYHTYVKLIAREEETPGSEIRRLAESLETKTYILPAPVRKELISSPKCQQPSIAVLPFESLGTQKNTAFTDAIYGDILTRLSQVSELFVTSRTSSQHYKSTKKQLPDIAQELGVVWILTGEVQEEDQRVKVSVRLVNALEHRHVWADIFERNLTAGELFHIQADIIQKIAEALKMKLSLQEEKAIRQAPTTSLEAFRLHAYARWSLDQRTEKGMRMAEDYFRQAIAHDAEYAQAWLGLADALTLLHDYSYAASQPEILSEAERAINMALSLNPTLAEAYASLGLLYATRRKGAEAIHYLKKAVALQPAYADAHAWLSWVHQLMGELEQGLESAQIGVSYNPLSQETLSNLCLALINKRDYSSALIEAERLLLLQPDFATAQFYQALALYHLKRYEDAKAVLQDLQEPWAGNGPLVTYGLCCLQLGDAVETEKLMKTIRGDTFAYGLLQAAKGQPEAAMTLFRQVVHWDYWAMLSVHYLYPAILDPIRQDKRFSEVLIQLNSSWGISQRKAASVHHQQELAILSNGDKPVTPDLSNTDMRSVETKNPSQSSIAVLPFDALLMQEPELAEGIHGDLLAGLGKVKTLQLISRSSVTYFKKSQKSPSEIGRTLHVFWLIKGKVSRVDDEIRVVVSLIHASSEEQVWSKTYQRALTAENIFAIVASIMHDLLEILNVHTISQKNLQASQPSTMNLQAYRLYSQGRSSLDQRTEAGLYQGLDCFEDCLSHDPQYALAWAGLADALSLLQFYGFTIPKSSTDAFSAAKLAVSLCSDMSEAHAALGVVHANRQEGAAALKALEHAASLAPGYAEVRCWLGWLYLILGKPKAALEPAEQAVRLNPLAPAFRAFLSEIYLANGLYEKALYEARRAREIKPDYGVAYFMEGLAFYHNGQLKEALEIFEQALYLASAMGTPSQAEVKIGLAFTYSALDEWGKVQEIRNQTYGRIDPFSLAMLQALQGELSEAFETFSRVEDWSSFSTEQLRYFFPDALNSFRTEPHYQKLISQLNLAWGLQANGSLP